MLGALPSFAVGRAEGCAGCKWLEAEWGPAAEWRLG